MPKAKYKKRFRNPDQNDQYVDVPIVDETTLKHGQGVIYRKLITNYQNDDGDTTRKVHLKTITHKAIGINGGPPDSGDATDDQNQRIIVEVIDEYTTKFGSGFIYQKSTDVLNQDKDTTTRKTHEVRIRNPDHSEWWVDVERIDEFTTKFGSGFVYQKTTTEFAWDDDDFNNSDVPVIEGNKEGERLDPIQNLVNVHWKDVVDGQGGGGPLILGGRLELEVLDTVSILGIPNQSNSPDTELYTEATHPQGIVEGALAGTPGAQFDSVPNDNDKRPYTLQYDLSGTVATFQALDNLGNPATAELAIDFSSVTFTTNYKVWNADELVFVHAGDESSGLGSSYVVRFYLRLV